MFNSIIGTNITPVNFIICLLTSFILGLVVAIMHKKVTKSNENFISTLVILPMVVSVVIMIVNGNLGTAVAVVGAFSLIKFRSIPGNSKEILSVFFAMAIGLSVGTGYIAYAIIFTIITAISSLLINAIKLGKNIQEEKVLKITIPEDLNYQNVFTDIFDKYLNSYKLQKTKTTNMGSLFELTYNVQLKEDTIEKELIDKIRVKNGNLKIILTNPIIEKEKL
ncbi:MAG: DUF4956 domain-containing protein [Bacilli bacterium]|nr:DUF4956 domain-containing protein [Bacilli bacterium]